MVKQRKHKLNAPVTKLKIHLEKTQKMKFDVNEDDLSTLVVIQKYYKITGKGR